MSGGGYLLDTHALLWFIEGDERLGARARSALADATVPALVSLASHWELCLKLQIGKLRLADGWRAVFDRVMAANGVRWLAIERRHIDGIGDLPFYHRDPFDRLLIAQARAEGLTILSGDARFAAYDVPVRW